MQTSLFDLENRYASLSEAGDPLAFAGVPDRVVAACGRVGEPFAVGAVGLAPQQIAAGVGGGDGGAEGVVVVVGELG